MSIKETAYNTTACRGISTTKIIDAVEKGIVEGAIGPVSKIPDIYGKPERVYGIVRNYATENSNIPPFLHPIVLKSPITGESIVVVDLRGPTRPVSTNREDFTVYSSFEYNLTVLRGMVQLEWSNGNKESFANISKLVLKNFSRLLGDALTKRFGLNPRDQMNFSILVAYFYVCNHYDLDEFTAHDKNKIAALIGRCCGFTVVDVLDVIDHAPVINTLEELADVARSTIQNVRLKDLNQGTIISAVGSSWFSTNATELMAVALEHPPTWVSILLAAYNERAYKNTVISKLAAADKSDEIKQFSNALISMVRS